MKMAGCLKRFCGVLNGGVEHRIQSQGKFLVRTVLESRPRSNRNWSSVSSGCTRSLSLFTGHQHQHQHQHQPQQQQLQQQQSLKKTSKTTQGVQVRCMTMETNNRLAQEMEDEIATYEAELVIVRGIVREHVLRRGSLDAADSIKAVDQLMQFVDEERTKDYDGHGVDFVKDVEQYKASTTFSGGGLSCEVLYEAFVRLLRHKDTGTAAELALPLSKYVGWVGNDDSALYSYATMRAMGHGGNKNETEAAFLFTKMAKKGNVHATYNLATMYLKGQGVKISVPRAISLFQFVAKEGITKAYNDLGQIYTDGMSAEQDYTEALKWFGIGSEAGCPQCHMSLANMFSHGKGVGQDHTIALHHHMVAADAGLAMAQHNVAIQYFTGKGADVDLHLAEHYFSLAAEQNFVHSQINLGNMYHTGYGVEVDLDKARQYYEAAAALGNKDAEGLLNSVNEKIVQADSEQKL